jgi:hypothetical protein
MDGLRGEGAQIMTKRSSQKRTFLKGSQGEALLQLCAKSFFKFAALCKRCF